MGKKLIAFSIILAFIIFEIYFKIFSAIITGLISLSSGTSLSLGIQSGKECCVFLLNAPSIMLQNAYFNMTSELWNCGNLELQNTTIELKVENQVGNQVFLVNESTPITMGKNTRRTFEDNYTANQSHGRYYFVTKGYCDGQVVENRRAFEIVLGYRVDLEILLNGSIPPTITAYCPKEFVNITNILENIGVKNVNGNLSTRILDQTSTEIHNKTWSNIDLLVNETESYETNYTVKDNDNAGLYTIHSNFTYETNSTYSTRQFRINKGIGNFYLSPSRIEKWIQPGSFDDTGEITLWLEDNCESATVTVNKTIGIPGDWVNFTDGEVFLPLVLPINQITVNITIPSDVSEGDYTGTIYANTDGIKVPIDLIVHVSGIAFTLNLTVPPEYKTVCVEDSVYADVNVEKSTSGPLDVNMTYRIQNSTTVIAESNKTLHIDNTVAQDNPSFTIPSSVEEGIYTFLGTLRYDRTQTESSDVFSVIKCIPTTTISPSGAGAPGPAPGPLAIPTPIYALSLSLSTDVLTAIIGNKTKFIAFVNNTGTETVNSVKVSVEGIPLSWINILPPMNDIRPGQTKEYFVTINVPDDAEPGVYILSVRATDGVMSETENLTLVIGRTPKEISYLLLSELEKLRLSANKSLVVSECINVSIMKFLYDDAEIVYKKGVKEYENGNYVDAINWFEVAVTSYKQVIFRVDIEVRSEIRRIRESKLFAQNAENRLTLIEKYLDEKSYEKICENIVLSKKLVMYGFIFWPLLTISLVLIVILVILFIKQRRERRENILEKIKSRIWEKKDNDKLIDDQAKKS